MNFEGQKKPQTDFMIQNEAMKALENETRKFVKMVRV